jgi:hypothetical protein
MTITIEIAPELQAELARQAATQGMGIDAYAAGLLQGAARRPISSESQPHAPAEEVVDAIDRLKSFGKTHALSLGGMTIRELRHEARP